MKVSGMPRPLKWFFISNVNWGQFNTFVLRSNHFWEPILLLQLRFHCSFQDGLLLPFISKIAVFFRNKINKMKMRYGFTAIYMVTWSITYLLLIFSSIVHIVLFSLWEMRKHLVTYWMLNTECWMHSFSTMEKANK